MRIALIENIFSSNESGEFTSGTLRNTKDFKRLLTRADWFSFYNISLRGLESSFFSLQLKRISRDESTQDCSLVGSQCAGYLTGQ